MKCDFEGKPKYIQGLYNHELEAAAKVLGCPFTLGPVPGLTVRRKSDRITLNRAMDHLRPNRIYIVEVTGHYLTVNTVDWTMCDNWTNGWVAVKGSVHAKKKVRRVAEVKKHRVF
jgi:hypothetical protein